MKNVLKLIGIIAIVAVIGLSMTACGGGDDGTDGGGGNTPTPVAPTITTTTLTNGTLENVYNQKLSATGDTPITWIVEIGTLPAGLAISSGGVISGTPTTLGTFTFTVKADNSTGNDTKSLSITIVSNVFTSISDFETWLAAQPDNATDTAYRVKLNVSDLGGGYSYIDSGFPAGSAGNAFYTNKTKYVSIDFSDSTFTSMESNAFYNCTSLISITIPNANSIGDYAFMGCTSLTAINVDTTNTAYSSQDGVLYNKAKTTLIQYPAGKTGNTFTIPGSVTSIEGFAFSNCNSLTSVTIPDSVTSIGTSAFSYCRRLTSVTFVTGSNITDANFGTNAFPEGNSGYGGNTLKTAYSTGKAGTYTRTAGGDTWTKTSG